MEGITMARNSFLLAVLSAALVALPFLGCDSPGGSNRGFAKFATIRLELHPSSPAAADAAPDAQNVPVPVSVMSSPFNSTSWFASP